MTTDNAGGEAATFEAHRRVLLGLAYRMTGSRADAEDIVQDAWLRWRTVDRGAVGNARAYLVQIATRLCLDRARSARARREVYVGQWLPEPVADMDAVATARAPDAAAEIANDLSFALLLTLERLSPLERAAFLLHDVFDLPFEEIATHLDRTADACRKLASRARNHVRASRPAREVAPETARRLFDAFHRAIETGDVAKFASMLANDAVLITDGGGRKAAALNPIHGRERILRFFAGIAAKSGMPGTEQMHRAQLNGRDGLIIEEPDGGIQTWWLDWQEDGSIGAIFLVRNPDKLVHLAGLIGTR